jgi:hypothetical protein
MDKTILVNSLTILYYFTIDKILYYYDYTLYVIMKTQMNLFSLSISESWTKSNSVILLLPKTVT